MVVKKWCKLSVHIKRLQFVRLLSFFLLFQVGLLVYSFGQVMENDASESERINLALRKTADGLLRLEGDSTSRIPSIEQVGNVYKVYLDKTINYDSLPNLLKNAFSIHQIDKEYHVMLKRCVDDLIDLGFHSEESKNVKTPIPCAGRELPKGCHYVEIRFLDGEMANAENFPWFKIGILGLVIPGLLLGIFVRWRSKQEEVAQSAEEKKRIFEKKKTIQNIDNELVATNVVPLIFGNIIESTPVSDIPDVWIYFANSRLHVNDQILFTNEVRKTLTYRETKLLSLFANNPDKLLEREFILEQVWANEGILVGRSVDVFVSRLRKKLINDPSLSIIAIHGVGYRLDTHNNEGN